MFIHVAELSAVDLTPCFPFLSADGKMSEAELSYYRQKLYSETEDIKRKFAGLVFDLQKSTEESYEFEDVLSVLLLYDPKFEGVLRGCETIAEAFIRASKFWSFYDYSIIKLLTSKLGNNTNKKELKKYKKSFQEYSRRQICQCPNNAFGDVEESEKELVLRNELNIKEVTIEELDKLQFKMNKMLKVTTMRLLHIDEGCACIKLTFRVLNVDGLQEITEEEKQALRDMGVIEITYGDLTCKHSL